MKEVWLQTRSETLLKAFEGGSRQNYLLQNPYRSPIKKMHLVIYLVIQMLALRDPSL